MEYYSGEEAFRSQNRIWSAKSGQSGPLRLNNADFNRQYRGKKFSVKQSNADRYTLVLANTVMPQEAPNQSSINMPSLQSRTMLDLPL